MMFDELLFNKKIIIMRVIFSVIFFLGVFQNLQAQELNYVEGDFFYDQHIYNIYSIENQLVLDDENQSLLREAQRKYQSKRAWGTVAIASTAATAVFYLSVKNQESNSDPIAGVVNTIGYGAMLIITTPVALVSTAGWLVTAVDYKDRVDEFVGNYNSNLSNGYRYQLELKTTNSGIGLVFTF